MTLAGKLTKPVQALPAARWVLHADEDGLWTLQLFRFTVYTKTYLAN